MPTKEDSRAKDRAYAQNYRETRKAMGFKHVTTYIPTGREKEFNVIVERMKADRAMEIVETSVVSSTEYQALSTRYFLPVPTIKELNEARTVFEHHPSILSICKECSKHIEQHNLLVNGLRLIENVTDEQYTLAMGKSVAHNYMANALWLEVMWLAEEHFKEEAPVG